MKNFKLKLSEKKVTEQEIQKWEEKVKQLNLSNSFNQKPTVSNQEFLTEVLTQLKTDLDRLHRGFLIHSDTWTYTETEVWTKKYNQTTESMNLHMRLYFLYTGQDFNF